MYTGKGERRDDKKNTTTRTMTQAGSKQQPVGEEAQSGWIPTWQGGDGKEGIMFFVLKQKQTIVTTIGGGEANCGWMP